MSKTKKFRAIARTVCAAALPVGLSPGYAQLQPVIEAPTDRNRGVIFSADKVARTSETEPLIASGHVEVHNAGRILKADEIHYYPDTEIIVAIGNVSVTEPTGEVFFAEQMELTTDMAEGVAANFSTLLQGEERISGNAIARRRVGNNTIRRAVYSACRICDARGNKKRPLWQIKSVKIIQDKKNEALHFQNARLEILGLPVLYTPYFQMPDPSKERASGLLSPTLGNSRRLGTFYEQPYYYVISDHQDITFSPKWTANNGTLYKGEYRLRTHNAGLVIQPGYAQTDGTEETIAGTERSVPENRFHFFGEGFYDINEKWRGSFDIDYVSDRDYLRSYDIEPESELREARGIFRPDRLDGDITLRRRTRRSHLSIQAIGFQSLRQSDRNGSSRFLVDNDFTPQILPRINYTAQYDTPWIGGTTDLSGNFLAIRRNEGLTSQRAIIQGNWERQFATPAGHLFGLSAELRADAYAYQNIPDGVEYCRPDLSFFDECAEDLPGEAETDSLTTNRFLPTIGAQWTYPLIKAIPSATFLIEPVIQLAASPSDDQGDDVLNEDSLFFEFDTTNLFDYSKSSGFDLWETGERLNYGVKAGVQFITGLKLDGILGQQLRTRDTNSFGDNSGLGSRQSDLVGEFNVTSKFLRMTNRFRFDREDSTFNRVESRIFGAYGPVSGGIEYLRLIQGDETGLMERDETANFSAAYEFNSNWYATGQWSEDIFASETTRQRLGIGYRDECIDFLITLDRTIDERTPDGPEYEQAFGFKLELGGIR